MAAPRRFRSLQQRGVAGRVALYWCDRNGHCHRDGRSGGRWIPPMEEEVVPVLRAEDATRAVAWYGRLGFVKEWEHQFEPGFPWFVSVARGNVRLYLSEHEGDARPNTLVHLYVKDIDAVSEEFGIRVDEAGSPDGNAISWTRTATDFAS